MKGGDVPDSKFDPKDLKKAIGVEREHGDDLDIITQIAKAHLKEDPKYYEKLEKVGL